MGGDRPSPFAICFVLSLVAHALLGWVLSDRATVRAMDFGTDQAVSVRLLVAAPPASPSPAPMAPTPPPVATPRPPPEQSVFESVTENGTPAAPIVEPQPTPISVPEPPAPVAAAASPPPVELAAPPAVSSPPPFDLAPTEPQGIQRDEIAEYVATVGSLIERQKRYPKLARKRKIEGRVVVVLEISPEGELTTVRLGSGAPRVLDRATEAAVRRAAPFPTPPGGGKTIEIELEYTLNDLS